MAVRELSSAPSMAVLYPKALAGAGRSAARRLPGVGTPERRLPDEELVLPDVEIRREHLAAYDRVCTFEVRDEIPATYPHILAFPLAMELMTRASFPFPVVGLVHIENRIEQLRPIRADEPLTLRVRTDRLGPHDRGTQFEIVADAHAGGEIAWRSTSLYLHREGGSSGASKNRSGEEPPEPSAELSVPGDIGRRYAAVSGDRNPIHLHPLTARLFGMPRPIAHGMWLKARCLALMGVLPDRYAVDVSFKLPVQLPARVAFSSGDRGFALQDAKSGKPHLAGAIESLR